MRNLKDCGIEWIGKIPDDWSIIRNKNAFMCSKELLGEKSELTQLLSLTTRGIKKKDINNAEGKLPESFDTYQFVKENDIVMCLFDLDCSAVFSGISPFDGMISPAYRVLSCEECMEPRYADYWFRYIFDGRKFNHYAKNIRYTLSYEEFSALPLLLPEKSEQRRIADYLYRKCSQIDAIIARQQKVIEKLKAYKLSVITEAVTKGLNPDVPMKNSGVEWLGDIPEYWQLSHIGNLVEMGSGGTPDRKKPEYWENGSIPWMSSGEINDEYIYSTTEHITELGLQNSNAKILPVNTVMLGLIGQGKTKGLTAILKTEVCCNQNLAYLIADEKYLHYRYLFYCFKAMYFYIRGLVGESQAGIYSHFLKKLHIPLPDIEQQIRISDYLDTKCEAIQGSINKRERMIEKFTDYKKSLIYEVVTGKKEV